VSIKRAWGTERRGPWAATYGSGRTGVGIGLSLSRSGWALSGSVAGRGGLIGWASQNVDWPIPDWYGEVEVQFNRR